MGRDCGSGVGERSQDVGGINEEIYSTLSIGGGEGVVLERCNVAYV